MNSRASCTLYDPVCLSRYNICFCLTDLHGEPFPGWAFIKGHLYSTFWGRSVHCFCCCSQKRWVKWAQGASGQDSSPVPSSLWEQNNSQINTNHSISTRTFGLIISFKDWVPVLTKQGELSHLDRRSFSRVNSHIWENKRNYFQAHGRSARKIWNNSVNSGSLWF